MSPRRSSTSSAERRPRSRYLGIEAAPEPLPPLSLSAWGGLLRQALPEAGRTPLRFRVVRASGRRAIVEVARDDLARARTAWEARPTEGAAPSPFTARRTWGTLVGAKAWLGERGTARRRGRVELTPR